MLRLLAVLLALVVGGVLPAGSARGATDPSATVRWSPLVCERVADGIARQGLRAVLHYRAPLSSYPADTYLLLVRTGLAGFRRQGCRPVVLARALARQLTSGQRVVLLSHLPSADARYLRRALARL